MIARGYSLQGNMDAARRFSDKAENRKAAIIAYCWDPDSGFFYDYNFVEGKRSDVKVLTSTYPLFFQLAKEDMAARVSTVIQNEFLQPGGLVTSLNDTGEQWDAPNGWAPLQWMTYQGLKNYGIHSVANTARVHWLDQNTRVYKATGRMMEKYNVVDTTLLAGGGEYPTQDGFGWTNGIALRFLQEESVANKTGKKVAVGMNY